MNQIFFYEIVIKKNKNISNDHKNSLNEPNNRNVYIIMVR